MLKHGKTVVLGLIMTGLLWSGSLWAQALVPTPDNPINPPGASDKRPIPRVPRMFQTQLTAANEVPPTNSQTRGTVMFRTEVTANGIVTAVNFMAAVQGGVSLRQAHFHCAPVGVNGPVVAFMAGRHDGGVDVRNGTWVQARLTDTSISSTGTGITTPVTCAAAGGAQGAVIATIDDFVQQALAGNIYACFHDATFPGGAIRGQLVARGVGSSDKDDDGTADTP